MFKQITIIMYLMLMVCFANEGLFAQQLAKKTSHHHCCYLNQIVIEGETNINQFNFVFDNSRYDIISIDENVKHEKSKNEIVEFKIPVKGFKGDNYLMENDFYNLLDATNYPTIVVGIEKPVLQRIFFGSNESVIDFYITIAGNTKHIIGDYKTFCQDDLTILSGEAKIKLTDFSLDPPKKMMGMLKVKDQIFITFDISLSSNQTLVKL
ncbi:MAG: YceI family protein [Bacteroidota bacterium]|nr:YceI family protein [Bacteroidota bacterium]